MQSRLISIDAFRAIIMVLMIFVNDLWSLVNIPTWLEHVSADTDGMGLADFVFPAFLFIVGLSIPYAIRSRRKKGNSTIKILLHILERTIALLVMGVFLVNAENYGENALLPMEIWVILLIVAFFLIWLDYKNPTSFNVKILKGVGILLLVLLAIGYRSNETVGIVAMKIHWWGILGLIGWAYFISSCVFLFSNGNLIIQTLAFVFFIFFSSATFLGWLAPLQSVREYIWIAENGATPAFSIAGIITSICYKWITPQKRKFWVAMMGFSVAVVLFGFITRPLWGISKIYATPSWIGICTGISIAGFMVFVLIADIKKKTEWYKVIKPAGTSTLTCYLLPYIHYSIIALLGLQLPVLFRTGMVGLGKSFLYALVIVLITGILEKKHIRLKI